MAKVISEYGSNYNTNNLFPDKYEYDTDGYLLQRPPADFVVARDKSGNIVSYYSSGIYDYSAYSNSKQKKLYFSKNIPDGYVSEAHWFIFLIERVGNSEYARNGNSLSVSNIYNYLMEVVRPICRYAYNKELAVDEVLSSKEHTSMLVNNNIENKSFVKYFPSFISKLYRIGMLHLGFQPVLSEETVELLKKATTKNDINEQQTPLIPPRIYLSLIAHSWLLIEEIAACITPLTKLINVAAKLPSKPKGSGQNTWLERRNKALEPFLKDSKLISFFDKHYTNDKGGKRYLKSDGSFSIKFLKLLVTDIYAISKLLIHAYTGMRDNEVRKLPLHCFNTKKIKGKRHARILGYTYKYSGFAKNGEWVTTDQLQKVFDILHPLTKALVSHRSDINVAKKAHDTKRTCPLFASPTLLTLNPEVVLPATNSSINNITFLASCELIITDEDILFLERIEPTRHWRSESDFKIGQKWIFKTHQFRRSLAVYARASGLVEIGSLQNQLKHLFDTTSYYYSNGAENADFDITSKDHFASEFADNQDEADFMLYVYDVIFSKERLYGSQGQKNQKMIDKISDKNVWIIENQKDFVKDIKNGKRSYKETPLGGCESIKPCNKKLLRSITACLSCIDANIKKHKLSKVIESQRIHIMHLHDGSIERRMEQDDLDELEKYQQSLAER